MHNRKYECVFIARQDLSRAQVDGLTEHFIKLVSDNQGSVQKNEYCGLRQLAYVIGKNKKGHYIELHIEGQPETIFEMERNMKLNSDVLRFLTIKVEEFSKSPSLLSQTKGFREKKHPTDPAKANMGRRFESNRADKGLRQTAATAGNEESAQQEGDA